MKRLTMNRLSRQARQKGKVRVTLNAWVHQVRCWGRLRPSDFRVVLVPLLETLGSVTRDSKPPYSSCVILSYFEVELKWETPSEGYDIALRLEENEREVLEGCM